jgi:geranylgeranyl diphosphate synthase, type II
MNAADDLQQYLTARRTAIDAALLAALPSPPSCPSAVADAMRYSVSAGGKRLRPILCLASAEAVGGDWRQAMPTACAIEFIHTYSLIHDDLPAMDNDTLRRGQPALHVIAGEAMAILAGDGLLTEAFALISREPRGADASLAARKVRVIEIVAAGAGAAGMVGGQAIDLACVTPDDAGVMPPPLDAEALRAMHARKTGALIRASASAGAVMGGASDAQIDAIDRAAAEFGLAFQIIDDVLDIEGVSTELGKTAGKDAAAGKPTYPALYGLEASKRMADECLARAAAALGAVRLADSRLLQIGRWIVERSK